MKEIAEGVHRLGSDWVNFYIVDEGGALTIVDTGLPGYADQLEPALARMGRGPADVKAIVLTHTHSDHIGCARVFSDATGAPVLVPSGEIRVATGEAKLVNPKGVLRGMWHGSMLGFVKHLSSNQGFKRVTVDAPVAFGPDEVLDVPGKLRVVYTPGHSSAHSALLLEGRRVLFCGDALATLAVNTGARGPMVHPFNQDRAQAIVSLGALEKVDADLVLPGHGDPWMDGPAEAVAEARA